MADCCLLCLQQSNEEFWDGIKADTRTWEELNIKAVLEKHFWPLNEILLPSSWICLKCWQNVRDFHKFYLRVEEAQLLAGKLRTIKTELQSYDSLAPEKAINQPQSSQYEVEIKTESLFDEPHLDVITSNQIQYSQTKFKEEPFEPFQNLNQTATEDEEFKAESFTYGEEWQENEPEDDGSDGATPAKMRWDKNYRDNDIFIMKYFKRIFCDLCKVELEDFADMQKHFTNVHKQVGYLMCCSRKFYHRYRLVDHIHTHLNPEHFKCDRCGRILSDRGKLRSHKLSVHRPVPVQLNYPCDVCGEAFSKANALRRHKYTHLPEEEKKFACSDCGQLFASVFVLNLHKDVLHLDKFEKVCNICGLTLHTNADYDAHMNKHADPVTSLDCDICGLRLDDESGLKLHKETQHPVYGKEDHKCPICPKISPTLRALKRHISTMHDRGCEYKCSLCEKAFRRPESLKEHMASHKGAALYKCPWCPKSFTLKRNMHAHSKRMHPKEREEEKLKLCTESVPQHSN